MNYPITDMHIHIQPWRQLKPAVADVMRVGKEAHWDRLIALMDDPKALLEVMDASGVWRVALINYPSPDLMGFDDSTNAFSARYAEAAPERILPYGGVHARFTKDPEGDVDRLMDLGIRCLKIHPPHQLYPGQRLHRGARGAGPDLPPLRGARAAGAGPHRHQHLPGGAIQVGQPDGTGRRRHRLSRT